jgi:hypothetical protein
VILRPLRRFFGHDDRLVLQAEPGGRALLIGDVGVYADFNAPEFEDVMDEQVVVRVFASAAGREAHLEASHIADRPSLLERIDEVLR